MLQEFDGSSEIEAVAGGNLDRRISVPQGILVVLGPGAAIVGPWASNPRATAKTGSRV